MNCRDVLWKSVQKRMTGVMSSAFANMQLFPTILQVFFRKNQKYLLTILCVYSTMTKKILGDMHFLQHRVKRETTIKGDTIHSDFWFCCARFHSRMVLKTCSIPMFVIFLCGSSGWGSKPNLILTKYQTDLPEILAPLRRGSTSRRYAIFS